MPAAGTIPALILVGSLVGCSTTTSLPTQTSYRVANLEQPQPVHYFYGTLVDVRPGSLEFGYEAGIGLTPRLGPWLAGLHVGAYGPRGYVKLSGGFVDILGVASAPNAPTAEYTVMLHKGTDPRDQTLRFGEPMAAVIVVQNELPDRYPDDVGMQKGDPVVVRVVGNSGRVMRSPLPDYAVPQLAAVTPMPVPIQRPVYEYPSDGFIDRTMGAGAAGHTYYPPGGMGRY
jgi:hypothetical protein